MNRELPKNPEPPKNGRKVLRETKLSKEEGLACSAGGWGWGCLGATGELIAPMVLSGQHWLSVNLSEWQMVTSSERGPTALR